MRPIPIPDHLVGPEGIRRTLTAPDGDLTNEEVHPVDVVLTAPRQWKTMQQAGPTYSLVIALEPEERKALAAGGYIMLTLHGACPPMNMQAVAAEVVERPESPIDRAISDGFAEFFGGRAQRRSDIFDAAQPTTPEQAVQYQRVEFAPIQQWEDGHVGIEIKGGRQCVPVCPQPWPHHTAP